MVMQLVKVRVLNNITDVVKLMTIFSDIASARALLHGDDPEHVRFSQQRRQEERRPYPLHAQEHTGQGDGGRSGILNMSPTNQD